jgi:TipAS antibiotic-recognition domain
MGEDPASPKAQALALRWKNLVGNFTGGHPEIPKGLNQMYSDQDNWPAQPRQADAIKPEIMDFLSKAMQAGK